MLARLAAGAFAALLACSPALAQAPAAPAPLPSPWHTQLDLGWVQTSGNSRLSTLNFGEQVTYAVAPWKFTETFALVHGSVGDSVTASNYNANLRADYSITGRLRAYGLGHYEHDRFAGIDRRLRQELGVSLSVLAAPQDTIDGEAGAGMTEDKGDTTAQRNYGSARLGARYRHTFRANTFLALKGEYIQDLKDSRNQQVNTDAALVAPVSTHVAVKLGYTVRYNAEPQPGLKTTDTIASAGIQVVF